MQKEDIMYVLSWVAAIMLLVGIPFAIGNALLSIVTMATWGVSRKDLKKFKSGMRWLKGENPKAYARIASMPKRNQPDAYNACQKKLVLFDDDDEGDKKESRQRHYRGEDSRPRYKDGHRRSSKKKKVYYED